jgi:hypothetical protein
MNGTEIYYHPNKSLNSSNPAREHFFLPSFFLQILLSVFVLAPQGAYII